MADCGCDVCIANENGVPYETGTDIDGNECLIIPSGVGRKAATYNSQDGEEPPADCCELPEHTGSFAYDTANATADYPGCVTHLCDPSVGWVGICGGGNVEDPEQRWCYDITAVPFPIEYGNNSESWLINGQNVLDGLTCDALPTPSYPGMVEQTCDFSAAGPIPNHPADWDALNWTDTGQGGNGVATVISATGDPVDGWACTRPTFRFDFGIPAGQGSGPYSFTTEITDGSGGIGFGMYDTCNGVYLPITGFNTTSTPDVAPQLEIINPTNLGDQFFMISRDGAGNPWQGTVDIDYANPNNVDASCLVMIVTAMGNYNGDNSQDNLEQIVNTSLTYTPAPTSLGTCCETLGGPADLAALMNQFDQNTTWIMDGNQICAADCHAPGEQTASYAALSFPCDSVNITPELIDCE